MATTPPTSSSLQRAFESRDGESPEALDIDDLGLEQAVFLEYATGERVLTPAWVEAVLEAQQDDGGWALAPSERGALAETHWHPTALALWALGLYSGQGGDETWVQDAGGRVGR